MRLRHAREAAASDRIPPPLVDSPKCPRCSLVTICLPDETHLCETELADAPGAAPENEAPAVRRLVPARDDLRPLYLNSQGFSVGKSGNVLQIREKGKLIQEVRINELSQLNLFGNVQISTQALHTLCESEISVSYFSHGGWFYGMTRGLGLKNVFMRREQFRKADAPDFCLRLARALVAGKIRNQRTMLQRNHVEPPGRSLALMKCYIEDAERTESLESLLGIEGNAARIYFENFAGMIKVGGTLPFQTPCGTNASSAENDPSAGNAEDHLPVAASSAPQGAAAMSTGQSPFEFRFDFAGRNRRPPRDPVNALLSLAYSVLAKDLTIVCQAVGLDPFLGFFHQLRFGRPSLALDLMEPMRPLIADSAVLSAINTRMVTERDFLRVGPSVALTADGRKAFFRAYEQRMDTLVTHPMFGYRVNYRRILEIQTRLLARFLTEEIQEYPVFVTR